MAENEIEHAVKTLTIDEGLPAAVDALKAEGWELVPGILPVAVYHVVRRKVSESVGTGEAQLRMSIDDSKILVVRNGKVVE